MDMPFFDYSQNNSGGKFDIDEEAGVSIYVIIEAADKRSADSKAEEIGLYFDGHGDCDTCGNRWYRADVSGSEVPSIYGEPISDYEFELYGPKWNRTGPEAYVHFADGTVQGYGLPKKQLG